MRVEILVGAAVMAILPGTIFIDRSFLPDPAMVSLVVTSFWMLVAYLQTDRRRYLVLASAIACWGWLTKITGLIVAIPMLYAVITILDRRRKLSLKKLLEIGVAGICAFIPVVAYYLWARHLSLTHPPYHFAGSGNWIWVRGWQEWLNKKIFVDELLDEIFVWLWTVPSFVLIVLGLILPVPGKEDTRTHDSEDLTIVNTLNSQIELPWLFHWWFLAAFILYFLGAKELVDNPWNLHIFNPMAAAFAGHAIVSLAPLISRVTILNNVIGTTIALLLVVAISGQQVLGYMFYDRSEISYKMALTLRHLSQPSDLIVTIADEIGDPIAIYYSQRRGWVFPPASPDRDWSELPKDDSESIQLFEKLISQGADWFAIVKEHEKRIQAEHPKFMQYIKRTCKIAKQTPKFVIYRIISSDKSKTI